MDTIATIIIGLLAGLAVLFGVDKAKNKKALKDNDKTIKKVNELETEKAHHKGALEIEEELRAQAKIVLSVKLERSVTDEEVNNFLNDRYRNS